MNNEINNSRLEQLLQLLELQPNEGFLCYAIGMEYRKAKRFHEAIHWFKKTLEKDTQYLAAWYQLAEVQLEVGDKDSSKSAYEAGIRLATALNDVKSLAEFKNALLNLEIND
ncbi:MAG: tetratricopeptide repeat protein [Bacteroidia bacterium]